MMKLVLKPEGFGIFFFFFLVVGFFWLLSIKASPSPLLRLGHLVIVSSEVFRALPRHEDLKKRCSGCIYNPKNGDSRTKQCQNVTAC